MVKGELLCDILRKADLSACELISYNPKADIFNLSEGDRLIIPIKSVDEKNYTILGENENLLTLSKKLDKSQIELLKLNPNLRPSEFSAGCSTTLPIAVMEYWSPMGIPMPQRGRSILPSGFHSSCFI